MMGASVVDHNVSLECIPSSPPGLSYSKSSKSSSSDEDDLSDTALTDKSTHFADVELNGDSAEDCNLPPDSRPTLKRPPPRSLTATGDVDSAARRRSGTSPPLRPLPNGMRQKYPSLQGVVNGALRDQSLNLPSGRRSMQRAASSPTSPFMRQHPHRIPSRSPSPGKPYGQQAFSASSQTLASNSSDALAKENGSVPRRPSWQPGTGRKTAEELEAEYNDDDEDVPEEAILENVPISPMPGHYNGLRSPSTASLRSTTPSPHRRPIYANLHSANIPKQAKRPHARASNAPPMPRSPKHVGRPAIPHSATISHFPAEPFSRKHRSKSWTEDLNEEAKQLSQALEEYAERTDSEKRSSLTNTPSSSPPRPSMPKQRAKSSAYEVSVHGLPPVQKGNIMIDPLPISKEKEAVLSRTRPSWLPPKDPIEEKKHLKEFQQMMARAAEAEKKRLLKEQENKENQKEMKGSLAKIWEQHVLPNWDAVVKEPRTRELWWRGVTPRNRGEVWQRAIGNELELSTASFEAALARANALERKFADLPAEAREKNKEAAWFKSIARDVPDTFPDLGIYQPDGGHLHQSLTDVLKAFATYRHDVGYVYGTHLVAGIICLLLPAPEAFVLLANMLNRPLPLAFLVHDQAAMARAYDLTLQTLKYKFTRLHDHLTNESVGLRAEEYLDPLFRCLFSYNLAPQHVMRILDVFVFEGDKALIRTAVAVLGRQESKLYGSRDEILDLVGWRNENRWDVGSEEEFMAAVREAGKVEGKMGGNA
ncbi:TBC domain-containing [Lecanosticta acicola]|uniref:TBC domain-containing n=1 Tax=Lecanosticta acicola TaxID=111012 RepID=A0AAI9E7W4_9PEZI|nr:TBC domain-containing [Lecanosticta acicola]